MRRLLFVAIAVVVGCGPIDTNEVMAPRVPTGGSGGTAAGNSFGATVRPILIKYCSECHNSGSPTGGLDVTSYQSIVAKVVIPGDADRSLMIQYLEEGVMPPVGKRDPSGEEIEAIRVWVASGAPNN